MASWKEKWNPRFVEVTNLCPRYKRGYEHMFDGVNFTFRYGEKTRVPEIAANHIFAYAAAQAWKAANESKDEQLIAKVRPVWEKERNFVLARNMWNMTAEGKPDPTGPATLSSFEINPVSSAEAA